MLYVVAALKASSQAIFILSFGSDSNSLQQREEFYDTANFRGKPWTKTSHRFSDAFPVKQDDLIFSKPQTKLGPPQRNNGSLASDKGLTNFSFMLQR